MAKRILVMGLPGSGKTTLAMELVKQLSAAGKTVTHFNADSVRKEFNDWDFSETGRIRQSVRMRFLAEKAKTDFVVCDFIAPLQEMRDSFKAHHTIWLDTIEEGRFDDTNKMFVAPTKYDFRITEKDAVKWVAVILQSL